MRTTAEKVKLLEMTKAVLDKLGIGYEERPGKISGTRLYTHDGIEVRPIERRSAFTKDKGSYWNFHFNTATSAYVAFAGNRAYLFLPPHRRKTIYVRCSKITHPHIAHAIRSHYGTTEPPRSIEHVRHTS